MQHLYILQSAADLGAIANAVKLNFLFKDLSDADRKHVIDAMQPKLASAGDWIITQGDKASKYYVVQEGKLEVRLRAPGASDNMGEVNGGDVIHVYDASKVNLLPFLPHHNVTSHPLTHSLTHSITTHLLTHTLFSTLLLSLLSPQQGTSGIWRAWFALQQASCSFCHCCHGLQTMDGRSMDVLQVHHGIDGSKKSAQTSTPYRTVVLLFVCTGETLTSILQYYTTPIESKSYPYLTHTLN